MRYSRWFTLIEMLVVVVIMGVLMVWLMWMGWGAVRRAAFDNDKVLLVNYFNETLSEFMSSPYIKGVWWPDVPIDFGQISIREWASKLDKKYHHGWASTATSSLDFKWSSIVQVDNGYSPLIAWGEAHLYLEKYAVWCQRNNTDGNLTTFDPWWRVWFKLQYGDNTSKLFACYRINMDACRLEELKLPILLPADCDYNQ